VLSDAMTKAVCDAIRMGCSDRLACESAGIDLETLQDHMARADAGEPELAEFAEQVRSAKSKIAQAMVSVHTKAAFAGDWRAADAWLRANRGSPQARGALPGGNLSARRAWRREHTERIAEIEELAIGSGQFTAAVTARRMIRASAAEDEAERLADEISAIADPIERAEAVAHAALGAGSFVAAEKAAIRADALRREAAEIERQRKVEAAENVSDEEAHALLLDALRDLPRAQALDVMAMLQQRPDIAQVAEA
jgi:hypothetical protein